MDWKQRALCRLISDISELCYSAGWMSGIEFSLWDKLTDRSQTGIGALGCVEPNDLDDLQAISDEIGGWVRWDSGKGEVFVPMAEWLEVYEREYMRYKRKR